MATLNYIVQSGESLFDIAAKLYNDFSFGLTDLMNLNAINLNSSLPATLVYTPGLSRIIPSYKIPIIDNPYQTFTVRKGQSWYDLAIQLYGTIEGISKLTGISPTLNIKPMEGMVLVYQEDLNANNALFLNNIIVSINSNIEVLANDDLSQILTSDDGTEILTP